jgi:hypothetical protein
MGSPPCAMGILQRSELFKRLEPFEFLGVVEAFEIARADEGLRKKLIEFINEKRQKS